MQELRNPLERWIAESRNAALTLKSQTFAFFPSSRPHGASTAWLQDSKSPVDILYDLQMQIKLQQQVPLSNMVAPQPRARNRETGQR